MRRKKLTLVGHELNIQIIAKILENANYEIRLIAIENWNRMPSWDKRLLFKETDIIHFLWGQHNIAVYLFAKAYQVKIINNYVGTDVLRLLRASRSKKLRAFICNILADRTICVSANLQKELLQLKIRSEIIPINYREYPLTLPKLPEKPAAYTYIPQHRSDFYGWPLIKNLASDFPEVTFYILAHDGSDEKEYKNIHFLGWQDDVEKWIRASTIHLRITEHDGLPRTVLEALAHGRHVIYSQNFPHCHHAKNYQTLKSKFRRLLDTSNLNVDGALYIKENFHPKIVTKRVIELYNLL